MACLTHCIFNLQQDAIVAVCSSPSLHLSEMGMAPFTARCNRRCLLIAIAPFAACIATVNALWPIQIGTVRWDRHCRFGSRGWEFATSRHQAGRAYGHSHSGFLLGNAYIWPPRELPGALCCGTPLLRTVSKIDCKRAASEV